MGRHMNPLLRRLASVRRRVRFLEGWRGLCAVLALVVGVATAAGLLDWYVNLPSLPRALVLTGLLGGAGFLAYRTLYLPLARPCDDLTLALRIEEQYPELNDALASTVQFVQQPADSPTAGSPGMREKAVRQALEKAASLDFMRIVNTRGIYLLTAAAALLAGTAGYFLLFHTTFAWTALCRLAEPFGPHTWTRVAMDRPPPTRVAIGQPYVLFGTVEGIVPAQATIEIMGQTRTDKVVPITRSGSAGAFRTALDMTQAKGEFRFRIVANDGSFPPRAGVWHTVKVLPPPSLVDLDGEASPQVALYVPKYTDLASPIQLTPGTRHIEALAGTKVVLRARADRPLKAAQISYAPENPLLAKAAMLSALGQADVLGGIAAFVAGTPVWAPVPAEFENQERTTFRITFMPWITGSYVLSLLDDDDLPQHFTGGLRVVVDPIPIVKLQRPGSTLTVQPDAEVAFAFDVEDATFAIRSVFVSYRRKTAEGTWAEEGPQRTTLYAGPSYGRALPRVLGLVGKMPAFGPIKLRPKRLNVASRWALRNQFKEGETVVLQVCADDFCDVYAVREPGRSHEVELRIVSKFELAKAVDEKLAEAQQELARMQKMQKNAADLVKDLVEKKTITQKEVDQVVEAEQMQRQVQERVGTRPDEGLRGELQKLLQMLKDNKMTDGEARIRAGMLKGELDRLAQQELQQALPKLAEARKALATEEQKGGKATPETKGTEPKEPETKGGGKEARQALDKAAELQRKAQKSLDELARAMNPWASMQQIRAEARDQREKQLALKQKLEELQGRKKDEEKVAPLNPEELKLYRDEMNKFAEAQKNLGKRADDLAKMMKDAHQKRVEQKDAEAAQRLKDALRQMEKDPLASRMRDVARDLEGKTAPPQKALQQQERAAKDLEKVIAALEGRGDDVTERLIKQREKAGKAMDRLQKKMRDLEKKVADAKKIADPQERLQKMKQLAKEHDALRQEMEEQARQLARLQEQRASNQLQGAAEDIDRAARKLGQGDPGEQERQEAKDRVKDAQKKFNENEQELAREQLAKIADRLKALKERQDAAVERSKDFHKRLMAKKFWADEYADSIGGDAEAQKGLAKDADTLREKIKQAKVYEHLLDRSARDMEKAAEIMEERKADGLANRADPKLGQLMEKEELENEDRLNGETVKYQKRAAQRLGHLLEALKQEIAKLDEKKKQREQNPEQGDQPDQQGPPMRAADGIPPMAQLKALRAEQLDVNERTADFAKRHPNTDNLTPAQRRDLEQIQQDQDRLYRLFQEVTAPAETKGDEP